LIYPWCALLLARKVREGKEGRAWRYGRTGQGMAGFLMTSFRITTCNMMTGWTMDDGR